MTTWRKNGLVGLAVVALGGAAVIPVAASESSTVGESTPTTISMDLDGPSIEPCGDGVARTWVEEASIAIGDRACWRVGADLGSDEISGATISVDVPAGLRVVSFAVGSGSSLSGFEFDPNGPSWRLTDTPLAGQRAELIIETTVDDPRQVIDGSALTPIATITTETADGTATASDGSTLRAATATLDLTTTIAPEQAPTGATIDTTTAVRNDGSLPTTVTFRTNLDDGLSCADVTSTDGGTCVDGTVGSYVEWIDVPLGPDESEERDVHITVPDRFDPGRVIENCGEVIRFVTPTADGSGFVTVTSPLADDPSGVNADPIEDCGESTVGEPLPEPSIDKTATTGIDGPGNGPTEAITGESVTYEIAVTIPEGAEFADGRLTDEVPAGIVIDDVTLTTRGGTPVAFPVSFDDDSLAVTWPNPYRNAAGSGVDEFLVTVTATVTATQPADYVNTAVFTSSVGTDTDDAPITVIDPPVPAPSIDKSASTDTATIGDTIDYTVTVTIPASTETLFDATVLDMLPVGLAFDGLVGTSCDRAGESCGLGATELVATAGSTTVGFGLGDVVGDDTTRTLAITYRTIVTNVLTTEDVLINEAVLVSNASDERPDPTDGDPAPAPGDFDDTTDPAETTVDVVEPLLVIDQDVNGQVDDTDERSASPGEKLTYTITVTNNGDGPAYDVVVTDVIDPRLTDFVDMTDDAEGVTLTDGDPSDGSVAWVIDGPIEPGETVTIEFMVMIPEDIDEATEFVTDADIPSYGGTPEPADGTRTYGDDPTDDVVNDTVVVDVTIVPTNSSLGDRIWFDRDDDGVQDGNEPGIPGVRVTLTGNGPDGIAGTADDVDRETTTDDDGEYLFDDLPAGSYTVTVDETTLPDGLEQTFGLQGGVDDPQPSVTVNLPENTDRDDVDFGYVGTGSIGDRVWWDRNEDGVQSDSDDDADREPGIDRVDVTVTFAGADGVFDTADDIVFTDETDEDGNYLVEGLPAGDYRVEVDENDLPDGFRPTFDEDDGVVDPDSVTIVELDAGEDHRTADFGYVGDGRLGDTIYLDLNDNGTQDPGEPGVPGQTVVVTWEGEDRAFGTDDDETFQIQTDVNGEYLLDGLPEDRFRIEVGTPDEPGITESATNNEDPDGDTPNASEVDLGGPEGDERLDQDFGYVGDNVIGDTIWWDVDRDGIDDGEPRLEGVDVTLTWLGPDFAPGGGDDVVIGTETTDENGEYLFTDLPDGTYVVEVDTNTVPDGFDNTVDPQGLPGDGDDAADDRSVVSVGTDDGGGDLPNVNLEQDFGYAGTGSIGDTIYLDQNGDGTQGDDEPGLEGVTVEVVYLGPDGEPDTGDEITFTDTTDENGEYLVEGLPAGDFVVTVVGGLPDGVDNTDDPDAAPGELGDSTSEVTLGLNPDGTVEDDLDQDFGYDADALIGDRVWFDRDRDGVQDADEPGIPGVEITVTFLGADGTEGTDDDQEFADTTDEDGNWLVTDIPNGDYVVEVTDGVPDGFGPTADFDSPADGTNTAGDERSETTLDVQDLDQDFGYAGDAAVEGRIWLDRDGDGTEDDPSDEPGLSPVDVTITWLGPDGVEGGDDDVSFTVTTDENGEYSLDGLPAGEYTITVDPDDLPEGVVVTGDPDDDGDLTTTVTLTENTTTTDQDFGVQGTSSIGDTVFYDRDEDGEQGDPEQEPGIEGVTVTLTSLGPDGVEGTEDDETFQTVTDENGEYLFDGLPAGEYIVTLDDSTLPEGTEPTVDEDGGVAANGGTPDRSTPVTLGENDDHLTADFGEVGPGSIGDTIYLDTDGDGVQDPGEPGLPAQPVTVIFEGPDGVLGTDDDVEFPTETDENGEYTVDGLPLGDYVVVVGDDEAPDITDVAENTGDPDAGEPGDQPNESQVTLTEDAPVDDDQDFGYQGVNSLGDTVWFDDDGDGIDDGPGPEGGVEDRLDGVDVTVTYLGPDGVEGTDDDVEITTETTDENGEYLATGLPDGTYVVTVDEDTVPDGLAPSVDVGDAGTPEEGTSPDGESTVTLQSTDDGVGGVTPDENLDQDFGYNDGATLSGTVVLDLDDSDDVSDDDAPLGGITVELIGPGDDGVFGTLDDEVVDSTMTDEDGDYSFTGLEPGDYVVVVDESTLPGGVDDAFDPDGDDDGDAPVTVGQNEDVTDVDFGYLGEGRIGDTIYLDLDDDDTQGDDEPGVAGQPVTLIWNGVDNTPGTLDDVTFETVTDENGEYLFDGLPDGIYTVVVGDGIDAEPGDENAEITDVAENVADPDGGDDDTSEVILSPLGREDLGQDFGYRGVNTLGDLVWFDDDADGEPAGDDTEPGIEDVTVTVTWFGLDGEEGTADDAVVATEVTDENGEYLAEGLPDGTYRTTVDETTLPDGLSNTNDRGDAANGPGEPTDGSSVTTLESTDDGAGDVTPDEDLDQDFGYVDGGSISGTIVLDLNDNEQADDGEGIPGVTVQLVDPGPDGVFGTPDDVVVDETTTDDNGDYTFPGLDAGDYVVVVDPDGDTLPEGTTPNFDTDASDGVGQPGDGDLVMPVTLEENPDGTVDDVDDVDAGVIGEGVIGDTVYLDLDGDGTQDAIPESGEPGVPGQTVTLSTPGDDGVLGTDDDEILDETTTDENGEYLFENLPDGDYLVTVGTPGEDGDAADDGIADRADNTGDPDGGTPNESEVTLSEGAREDLDQDFGYQGVNELGDTIWFDENANGIDEDDAAEPGIEGVPVNVTWAGLDDVLGPALDGSVDDVELPASETGAVTDENGEYEVTGLPDGTYLVEVDETADALDGLANTADSADDAGDPVDGSSVAVFDGDDPNDNVDPTHDYGYVDGGEISGTIVFDLDESGANDDGDEGIPGVRVVLFDDQGNPIAETTTDENGDYSFPGLDAGDYIVDVDETTLPEGLTQTFDTDDGAPGDGDGTMPVTLDENPDGTVDSVDGVDAGYLGEGVIGDTVYLDLDRSGDQGDDEPGVPGQTVTLTGAGADDTFGTPDDLVRETTTDENGEYLFEGLPDGDYVVTVGTPGEEPGAEDDGIADVAENTDDPDGGTPNESEVTLEEGAREDLDQDFGYAGVNSLGDTVFLDEGADGTQDPTDEGIENVDVTVTWFGPDGEPGGGDDVVVDVLTTDQNGEYLFENLPDGTFGVDVVDSTVPAGLDNTVDVGDDGTPEEGSIPDGESTVTLQSTDDGNGGITPDENLDQDFGYVPGGSISGRVVFDLDGENDDDADEPGVPGVTVTLTGPDGIERTTTTDENGEYTFPGLPAGDYVVTIDKDSLPEGTELTFDTDDGAPGNGDGVQPVTLGTNPDGTIEDVIDVDSGVVADGRIGDTIYLDDDGDGVQDDDEVGVPGQVVTLLGDGADGVFGTPDDIVRETTTDENGEYLFEGLPDGDYVITVGSPANPGIVDRAENTGDPDGGTPNESATTLEDGDREDLDQDFGYRGPNSIGDTVFLDEDADGTQDPTDEGIEDVTVKVTWHGLDDVLGTDDDVEYTATTDENGEYSVENLPDGTYTVMLDPATLPDDADPTVDAADQPGDPIDGMSTVVLGDDVANPDDPAEGENEDGVDFGVVPGGSISGTIVLDRNGNDTQDAGEPGLEGVTVILTGPGPDGIEGTDDDILRETTTDENGDYSFPGLPAGDYEVTIDETTLPDGTTATFDTDPDGADNPDRTTSVTLEEGPDGDITDATDVDFGEQGPGVIGGTIYHDTDGDGTQDPDEPGQPNQPVTITWAGPDGVFGPGPDGDTDDVSFPTVTDENGEYEVDGLPDGDYQIVVGPGLPDVADPTEDPDGGADNTSAVTLDPDNREETDQDFGYTGDNAIGDTVFVDANQNGADDGADTDPRVPGATVTLTWFGPDGVEGTDDDVTFTPQVTDSNGEYGFDGLPDGTYSVELDTTTIPAGTAPFVDPDGGTPDGVSVVSVEGGETNDEQDFGVSGGATLGDTVWLDLDGDGIRDLGEPGVTGAIVTATFLGADGIEGTDDDVVFTTTVDEAGNYLFEGLPAGEYVVTVTGLPAGVVPTFDPDGGDDFTSRVVLGLDDTNLDQDFGVNGTASIDGTVFSDLDGDGVQDANEPGVGGVTVEVTLDGPNGPITTTVTTDANGDWSIENIPPGDYEVDLDPDSLPDGTVPGNTSPTEVTVPPNGSASVDLPVVVPGDVTGVIINDQDRDNVADPNEPGVPDVTVILVDDDGQEVDRTTTDSDGRYSFDDVPPGIYTVEVIPSTIPDGQVIVSDPDGTLDGVVNVTVRPGETTDAGVIGIDIPGRVIPANPSNPTTPNRPLPRSGTDLTGLLVQFGLLSMLLGGVLVAANRRRPGQIQGE